MKSPRRPDRLPPLLLLLLASPVRRRLLVLLLLLMLLPAEVETLRVVLGLTVVPLVRLLLLMLQLLQVILMLLLLLLLSELLLLLREVSVLAGDVEQDGRLKFVAGSEKANLVSQVERKAG